MRRLFALLALVPALALAQPAPLPATPCLSDALVYSPDSLVAKQYGTRGSLYYPDGSSLYSVGKRATMDSLVYVEHWFVAPADTAHYTRVCLGRLVASNDRATWTVYRRSRTAKGALTWTRLATVNWLALSTDITRYMAALLVP